MTAAISDGISEGEKDRTHSGPSRPASSSTLPGDGSSPPARPGRLSRLILQQMLAGFDTATEVSISSTRAKIPGRVKPSRVADNDRCCPEVDRSADRYYRRQRCVYQCDYESEKLGPVSARPSLRGLFQLRWRRYRQYWCIRSLVRCR